MRAKGLRITHIRDVPEFTVAVKALHITDVQTLAKQAPIDIAFVCVKSYDTAWATTMIAQYLSPSGFVVSLQNCMNEETVAKVVGWGRVVGSIASSITVDLCEPGHVRRAAAKGGAAHTVFRVGEVHGRITDRVQEVHRLVAYADSAQVTTNLWGERWSKLVANVMGNGLSACTGLVSKDVIADDGVAALLVAAGQRGDPRRPGARLHAGGNPAHAAGDDRAGRRGRPGGDAVRGRAPAEIRGRRRPSPVHGPGHDEGPPHRDRVHQRLRRRARSRDRDFNPGQLGDHRYRQARGKGRDPGGTSVTSWICA